MALSASVRRTCVMGHANALNAFFQVGHRSQASHNPAVTETALLHIARGDILHESGCLKDLVHAFNGLGHGCAGAQQGRAIELELLLAKAVETMTLLVLEIPVLQ